jgi:hypothetical protein
MTTIRPVDMGINHSTVLNMLLVDKWDTDLIDILG